MRAFTAIFSSTGWIILIILNMTVCFPDSSRAESSLVFGSLENSPPLSYETDDVFHGFFVDVFREVSQRAGFDIRMVLYPVKRMEAYLQAGVIDGVAALIPTALRSEYLVFSRNPVMTSRSLIFVKKGREFPFNDVRDLYGKRLGILLGWEFMNPDIKLAIQAVAIKTDPVTSARHNLRKLMLERIDGFIGTEQLSWYYANLSGVAPAITALETPVATISVYYAVSKHSKSIKEPQTFIRTLDASFKAVVADGTYKKIQQRNKITAPESSTETASPEL